jgi:hypothetical protein
MKYHTPQVQPVGIASKLIQVKLPNSTDRHLPGQLPAASNLLEK